MKVAKISLQSLKSKLTSSESNSRKLPHPRKQLLLGHLFQQALSKGLVEQKVHSHHGIHQAKERLRMGEHPAKIITTV